MLNDPVTAAVTRLRMDLETARAALTRANQRLRDLEGQDLSREQLAAFIGNHGVNSLVAEVNALGQAIAGKTS
jgi:phosphotransferase system IIB component